MREGGGRREWMAEGEEGAKEGEEEGEEEEEGVKLGEKEVKTLVLVP